MNRSQGLPAKGKMQARAEARQAKQAQIAAAIAAASDMGWIGCGHLVSNALRSSPYFKLLPERQRFSFSYVVNGSTGCWDWIASRKGGGGYGQIRFGRRNCNAHRVSYQLLVGPIPENLTLDHTCQNKACVNPDHLEPVSGAENTRRWSASITHCPKGHEFTVANTRYRDGRKTCRECHNERCRQRQAKITLASQATRGEKRKLADADVDEMRRLRSMGERVVDIALCFGVSAKYTSAVITGTRTRKRSHTGPGTATMRALAIRSGDICEFVACNSLAIHTHHRRPRRMGGTSDLRANLPSNLLRLCLDHHEWIESNRTEAYRLGLLVSADSDPASLPALTRHAESSVFLYSNGSFGSRPEVTA